MAGFKVRVILGGMCAFVPQEESGEKCLWALLVDARQPDSSIPDMKPHGGVIQFPLANVQGLEGAPSNAFGTWSLDEQDVRIETGGAQPIEITGFVGSRLTAPPVGGGDTRSGNLGFLASIGEACEARGLGDAGRVKPGLIAPTIPEADRKGILGRFRFAEGVARAGDIVRNDGRPIVWSFRPPDLEDSATDHQQYIAGGVEIEIDVPGPSMTLRSQAFDGSREQKIVLQPAGGDEICLLILNEESDRITGLGSPDPIEPDVVRPADRMFALFRHLCSQPPGLSEFPIPVPKVLENRPIINPPTWGSPPCASGRLEA